MTATSFSRGHKIYYNYEEEEWRYVDDDTSADIERPCIRCGDYPTSEGYDYCLGYLGDEVTSACCGHGVVDGYYVVDGVKKKLKK